MKVFIGGGRSLSVLPEAVKEKLDKYMDGEAEILVGDSDGADWLMQNYFHDDGYL